MAVKVCDTEPCDRLKRALLAFFDIEEHYDPEKGLMIAYLQRKAKKGVGQVEPMYFKYCPFCGTRVALGLVDGLEEDRYRVQRIGA